jgi:death-on-curing protein
VADEVIYVKFDQYLKAASLELNTSVEALRRLANQQLAESALGAPSSGFGGVEQYPSFIEKVAILLWRLAANHPLPDGNKRAALQCAVLFANLNGYDWEPPEADDPDGDETYEVVSAAAQSHIPVGALSAWVGHRLVPVDLPPGEEGSSEVTVIYPAEFIGMLPYQDDVISIGEVTVRDVHGYNPAAVYVRRVGGKTEGISVAEIIISVVGDAYAQEELDAENAEAERYPLGSKEYWRGKLVGRAAYSDGHVMTNEDFEQEWPEPGE